MRAHKSHFSLVTATVAVFTAATAADDNDDDVALANRSPRKAASTVADVPRTTKDTPLPAFLLFLRRCHLPTHSLTCLLLRYQHRRRRHRRCD